MVENKSIFSPSRQLCPWIEMHNTTAEDINLSSWRLCGGEYEYMFPEGTIISAGEYYVLWLDDHTDASQLLSGERTLSLFTAEDRLSDRLDVSVVSGSFSFIREGDLLSESEAPSPGYENSTSGQAAYISEISRDTDAVRISEVMIKNRSVLMDTFGQFSDWIELENISDRDINLKGWHISDKGSDIGWEFPDLIVPAGHRILIFASSQDCREGQIHTDFSLSQGEIVRLTNNRGYFVDEIVCTSGNADTALALSPDGEFEETFYPTPGFENSRNGYDAWQNTLCPQGPLVINEVMVANFLNNHLSTAGNRDWAEIKNISSEPVLLSDYYLSDDNDNYLKWQLPARALAPGASILIICDKDGPQRTDYYPCADFSLDSSSESLFLSDSSHVSDYVFLRDIPLECSYGRTNSENGFFFFDHPSPCRDNNQAYRWVSETPAALTPDGTYDNVDSVTVELSARGHIYYTLDGSLPDASSIPYDGPITIYESTIIRALAVEDGGMPSRVLNLSYFINEGHSLPVLSLVMDDLSSFNGIYYNGIKHVEMPGSLSLYEADGSFTIGCGVTMSGMTSLNLPKKNMSVKFRGAYGDPWLNYDVFDGGVDKFTNLTLRSGQDYYSAIIRNELCQNLCLQFSDNVVNQRGKYCVLYINGEYRGIYALKDKVNRQLYASQAGVSKDSVTMIDGPAAMNTDFYKEVYQYVTTHDMRSKENYDQFCSVMDIDSLIDWLIMEGYCANGDILSGNVRYCRSTENGGKWKVVFYDLDATLLRSYNTFYNLLASPRANVQQISIIITPLLKNEDFVDRLLTRFAEALNGPLTNENVLLEINRLVAQLEPEIERDSLRWHTSTYRWTSNVDYLKNFIVGNDYRKFNIDVICDILNVNDEQKTAYFGQ